MESITEITEEEDKKAKIKKNLKTIGMIVGGLVLAAAATLIGFNIGYGKGHDDGYDDGYVDGWLDCDDFYDYLYTDYDFFDEF